MGIMDIIKSPSFIAGVAKEGISIYDKAEEVGQEGLENLKIARKEVAETVGDLTDKYNMAQTVGDRVGGGAFAKYLFKSKSIDYLASLSDSTEESFSEEMSALKSSFNNLSKEDKESLDEFNVSDKYAADVADAKVKGNLVATNNIGESTGKLTLAERMTSGVRAGFDTREKDIIDSVGGGTLRDPDPMEGGFENIAQISSVKPFLSLNYQDAAKYNKDYLSWFKDNYRDAMTGEIRDPDAVNDRLVDSLVRAGYNIMADDNKSRVDDDKLNSLLEGIASQENTTRQGAVEEIIRESYFDQFFGLGSYGDGYLSMKRNNVAAEQGQDAPTTLTVSDDFSNLSQADQMAEVRKKIENELGSSEEISDEDILDIINQSQQSS